MKNQNQLFNQLLKNLFLNMFQRLLKLSKHHSNQYVDRHGAWHFQEGIIIFSHEFLIHINLERYVENFWLDRIKKMQGMLLQSKVEIPIVPRIVN